MTEQATLQPSEAIMFSLRSLYDRYGYSIYKMNKFEYKNDYYMKEHLVDSKLFKEPIDESPVPPIAN